MMPSPPPPQLMIVGEWYSRDDLLAYGRAVAEACEALVQEESLRGLPDHPTHDGFLQIACGVAFAAAIREMAKESGK